MFTILAETRVNTNGVGLFQGEDSLRLGIEEAHVQYTFNVVFR